MATRTSGIRRKAAADATGTVLGTAGAEEPPPPLARAAASRAMPPPAARARAPLSSPPLAAARSGVLRAGNGPRTNALCCLAPRCVAPRLRHPSAEHTDLLRARPI